MVLPPLLRNQLADVEVFKTEAGVWTQKALLGGKTMCKICLCCISSYWSPIGGFGNLWTSEGLFSLPALRLLGYLSPKLP